MATKGITVKELYNDLRQEILAGNGDKTILISSDDLCPSFFIFYIYAIIKI